MKESPDASQTSGPVERALNLLLCFDALGNDADGISLTALARQTNLAPSTALRLLKLLEHYEFVRRGSDRLYHLGPQIIQLGLVALRGMSLYEVTRSHLRTLAETTGESAHLGILSGSDVLYVDQVSSQRLVQAGRWIGRTVPLEGTAIGSAIRGQVGPDGYMATRNSVEPDVTSIAASIFDQSGSIVGAINVIGPTYRISDAHVVEFGTLLAEHARQISRELGATPNDR